MKSPDLSDWIQRYFQEYLVRQRNVSPATVAAYRDTFRLLLQYWRQKRRQAPRSPWQSPYVERLIGTIRRECLDQLLILNAAHLHCTLCRFFDYYHRVRPHRSLDHDAPVSRPVEGPEQGKVIELPVLGGLHHRYARRAA